MRTNAPRCGMLTRDEIARDLGAGVDPADLADRAGVTRATLHNALSVWGLAVQRGGDHRSRHWRTLWREQLAAAIGGAA